MNAVICSAANPRIDFRKSKAPAMIAGRPAAANLPNNLIKALSLFFNQFFTCSGFEGEFELPPELPTVKLVTIVSIIKPKDIKIAVIVIPCSLNTVLIFSLTVKSPSSIFSIV